MIALYMLYTLAVIAWAIVSYRGKRGHDTARDIGVLVWLNSMFLLFILIMNLEKLP